jgi:hypothetical protein
MSFSVIVSRARAARVLASETVADASKHAALLVYGDPITFVTAVVLSLFYGKR